MGPPKRRGIQLKRIITSFTTTEEDQFKRQRYILTELDGKFQCIPVGESPTDPKAGVSRWSASSESSRSEYSDTNGRGLDDLEDDIELPEPLHLRRRSTSYSPVDNNLEEETKEYFLISSDRRLSGWRRFYCDRPLMRCLDPKTENRAHELLFKMLYEDVNTIRDSNPYSRGQLEVYMFWRDVREQLRMDSPSLDGHSEEETAEIENILDLPGTSCSSTKQRRVERPHFGNPKYLKEVKEVFMLKLEQTRCRNRDSFLPSLSESSAPQDNT